MANGSPSGSCLFFGFSVSFHLEWHGKSFFFLVIFEDFLPKTLFIQKKVVPLWQQFPPRLLTMRTTVGLRFLYKVKILNDGNIYK